VLSTLKELINLKLKLRLHSLHHRQLRLKHSLKPLHHKHKQDQLSIGLNRKHFCEVHER
jgi:hypothetical protein